MFQTISRRGSHLALRTATLALPVLAVSCVHAQVLYGTLTGNVTDAQNAAVPGATVTIVNTGTGLSRTATTDSSGNYQIVDVPQGTYTITIAGSGFGSSETKNVPIAVNQTKRVDATLTVGGVSQSVDVSTAPPALQTDRADVNYEISSTQVAQLPTTGTAGRNFQGLYRLIPGVPPPLEKNSQAGNPGRAQAVNANGVAQTINSTKIDGASVGYPWLQSLVAYIPPTDAIESANIVTNSFNAEQGAAGGIAANLIVKSGTNRFHGGAWEYNSISQFNAHSYFNRNPVLPKNIYNEYGANIGGPIKKDRLFFFFNYNKVSIRRFVNGPNTYNVPLAAIRGGDFSSVLTGGFGLTAAQTAIFDPATGSATGTGRTQFANNIIPTNRLSAPAVRMLSNVPLPTSNAITNNFLGGQTLTYDRGSYDTKISYNPTDRTTFFGRYSVQRSQITDPPALGSSVATGSNNGAVGNTWDGGQPGSAPGTIQNIGLGATHTFTPNFLIDGNAGFVRINLAAQGPDIGTNYGLNYLGIPGTNGTTNFQSGLPGFILNNSLSYIGNQLNSNPFQFRDMQYVGNLNGTWIRGNHSIRFGGEYVHSAINHLQTNNNGPRGQFSFSGGVTALAGATNGSQTPNYFRSVADFLLGLPQTVGKTIQLFQPNGPRFSVFGFYAQDTWKATPNLTINYGLRYEYYPFANRDHTGVFRFDPATSNVLIGGRGNVPTDTGEQIGYGQFVPRLGVNYRVDDKTVIRSGFGITVDPENYRFFRDSYPALITLNNTGSSNFVPAGSLSTVNQTGPYGTLNVGIPTVGIPDINSGTVAMPFNYTTQTAPQRWRRGYVETWNLFVDRDLARGMVASVGYVGTHHVRQVLGIDINAAGVNPANNAGRPLFANANAPGGAQRYSSQILNVLPAGDEQYSGLQAQFTDRQLKSFQFGYAYTWSHSMNYYDLDSTLGAATFSTPALYKRNYGNSQYDRTHINALWTVWQIPFGPGRQYLSSGIVGRLVGGFDLNTITSYVSGSPFQISDGSINGFGDTSVPNQVSKLALTGTRYVPTAASPNPTSPNYFVNSGNIVRASGTVNGNIGRNTYRGPGYFNLDVALSRNIPIWRELAINLKAESFDITNTPQFSNPVADLANSAGFGQIQSVVTNSNRQLRLSGRITF